MSKLNQLQEAIRNYIENAARDAIRNLDIDAIAEEIAEDAIRNEIGDLDSQILARINENAADWQGHHFVDEIVNEVVDEYFS